MNQYEFDKIIAGLQELAKFGWYIYSMKVYEVYPCRWEGFIKISELLARQNMKGKDNLFKVECCHN
ncbi:MAG TPA: hypothetical protein QF468_11935 [Nitrospinota bacterium]|jgi:hypothetical protein|nr:hypothetical protein [Nitrospinota bacterium]|tara:strand:- start:2061 stop:2258 length:198 start_codon:yes stop_codon:yes gene_type:complete